jgi:PAS domain-containing protein
MPSDDGWLPYVHPDDRARTLANYAELVQRGEGELQTEARYLRHDGVYRWFVSRAVAVRDAAGKLAHVVGTSTDIEDLKVAEAALRHSQQRLENAIRASNIGLWDGTTAAIAVYLSPEWKRQLGYEDHEISDRLDEWSSRVIRTMRHVSTPT